MSGGFFRGTSTDQDTRFSNKKAKLLKSQKFAQELETLVDTTKVKMDVMRPWIAKRVTELIGFEDEVLINFIYGLLEGKEVNGKEVQISLTGFMERNTGKFMKELWLLLLSAQQNLSGVPQQFLDAKEEETKKKKAETDRIANEIHKKREKERQELEQEKTNMDGVGEMLRDKHAEGELNLKPDLRLSSFLTAGEEEQNERKHLRGRSRISRSPDSAYHSSSPRQKRSPPSKSFSNSRSYSDERQRSRSISKSPPLRSRSDSSERRYSTSPKRSLTPRRRYVVRHSPFPLRRRSSHSKRRSVSHSRRRSPSPTRYRVRSPWRRRSRSPRRWSRSPIRTSPMRRRSPSPMRRRSPSPVRRRSPIPVRRRSPSPVRRRSPSPVRRRSLSSMRGRSPSPRSRRSPSPRHRLSPSPRHCPSRSPRRRRPQSLRRHSPSPVRRRYQRSPSTTRQRPLSPVHRGSSMLGRKRSLTPALRRSPSPQESSSRSPIRNSSLSPVRKGSPKSLRSPPQSPGERVRGHEKHSHARSTSPREKRTEISAKDHRGSKPVDRKPIISLRSPQRDTLDRNDSRVKEPASTPSMQKYPFVSGASRERGYGEDQRSSSPRGSIHQKRERLIRPESPSPVLKTAATKPRRDNSGTSADDENFSTREVREHKYRSSGKVSPTPDRRKDFIESAKVHVLDEGSKARKSQLTNSEKLFDRVNHKEREQQELSATPKTTSRSEKGRESNVDEGDRTGDKNSGQAEDSKGAYRVQEQEVLPKLLRKSELNDRNGSMGSPSKETDEHKTKVKEKRKHKKSDRHEVESDDYSSYDSYEERKEAKRRRKEDKRLKKEERRRRRDDRRRRKEERRAEKRKLKSTNAGSPPSDLERDHSEDESCRRQESRSNNQEAKSEQKNLEIALREKALESLRAKKGIGN